MSQVPSTAPFSLVLPPPTPWIFYATGCLPATRSLTHTLRIRRTKIEETTFFPVLPECRMALQAIFAETRYPKHLEIWKSFIPCTKLFLKDFWHEDEWSATGSGSGSTHVVEMFYRFHRTQKVVWLLRVPISCSIPGLDSQSLALVCGQFLFEQLGNQPKIEALTGMNPKTGQPTIEAALCWLPILWLPYRNLVQRV